jgi:hypothetical protein
MLPQGFYSTSSIAFITVYVKRRNPHDAQRYDVPLTQVHGQRRKWRIPTSVAPGSICIDRCVGHLQKRGASLQRIRMCIQIFSPPTTPPTKRDRTKEIRPRIPHRIFTRNLPPKLSLSFRRLRSRNSYMFRAWPRCANIYPRILRRFLAVGIGRISNGTRLISDCFGLPPQIV